VFEDFFLGVVSCVLFAMVGIPPSCGGGCFLCFFEFPSAFFFVVFPLVYILFNIIAFTFHYDRPLNDEGTVKFSFLIFLPFPHAFRLLSILVPHTRCTSLSLWEILSFFTDLSLETLRF